MDKKINNDLQNTTQKTNRATRTPLTSSPLKTVSELTYITMPTIRSKKTNYFCVVSMWQEISMGKFYRNLLTMRTLLWVYCFAVVFHDTLIWPDGLNTSENDFSFVQSKRCILYASMIYDKKVWRYVKGYIKRSRK